MTATDLLRNVLRYGLVLSAAIGIVGGVIGFLVAGPAGLWGALIGTAMALVFTSLTALSIQLAVRVTKMDMLNPLFFLIVLGVMVVKFIMFIVIATLLRGQDFINPAMLFSTLIVAVIGTLVTDSIAFMRSRVPYVDDRNAQAG